MLYLETLASYRSVYRNIKVQYGAQSSTFVMFMSRQGTQTYFYVVSHDFPGRGLPLLKFHILLGM
jgi:hypothetical protein